MSVSGGFNQGRRLNSRYTCVINDLLGDLIQNAPGGYALTLDQSLTMPILQFSKGTLQCRIIRIQLLLRLQHRSQRKRMVVVQNACNDWPGLNCRCRELWPYPLRRCIGLRRVICQTSKLSSLSFQSLRRCVCAHRPRTQIGVDRAQY